MSIHVNQRLPVNINIVKPTYVRMQFECKRLFKLTLLSISSNSIIKKNADDRHESQLNDKSSNLFYFLIHIMNQMYCYYTNI